MNIFQTISDTVSLSFCSVSELGDEELIQCNKIRVVVAFVAWFLFLCSAFNVMFGGAYWILLIVALALSVNSALAFFEVRDRKKQGDFESDEDDDQENK